MFSKGRNRSRAIRFEGLESRALLNAAMPHPAAAAEIGALAVKPRHSVKITVQGNITSLVPTPNGAQITFTGAGSSSLAGQVTLNGGYLESSSSGKRQSTDSYSNGLASLSTSSGSALNATFTGSGHTKTNGQFTAKLHGTSTGTAGLLAGQTMSFTATTSGNTKTGAFSITFALKV